MTGCQKDGYTPGNRPVFSVLFCFNYRPRPWRWVEITHIADGRLIIYSDIEIKISSLLFAVCTPRDDDDPVLLKIIYAVQERLNYDITTVLSCKTS